MFRVDLRAMMSLFAYDVLASPFGTVADLTIQIH
jgi:hypothetical protein